MLSYRVHGMRKGHSWPEVRICQVQNHSRLCCILRKALKLNVQAEAIKKHEVKQQTKIRVKPEVPPKPKRKVKSVVKEEQVAKSGIEPLPEIVNESVAIPNLEGITNAEVIGQAEDRAKLMPESKAEDVLQIKPDVISAVIANLKVIPKPEVMIQAEQTKREDIPQNKQEVITNLNALLKPAGIAKPEAIAKGKKMPTTMSQSRPEAISKTKLKGIKEFRSTKKDIENPYVKTKQEVIPLKKVEVKTLEIESHIKPELMSQIKSDVIRQTEEDVIPKLKKRPKQKHQPNPKMMFKKLIAGAKTKEVKAKLETEMKTDFHEHHAVGDEVKSADNLIEEWRRYYVKFLKDLQHYEPQANQTPGDVPKIKQVKTKLEAELKGDLNEQHSIGNGLESADDLIKEWRRYHASFLRQRQRYEQIYRDRLEMIRELGKIGEGLHQMRQDFARCNVPHVRH
ncbi:uncharacterized protein LOC108040516 [Drosophila rhopaloa]|uniref:Uncharacterized protein LOC108040516 n=1 Tax=Drosophila rhopaloa TaxID=1041015 RepID=A0A6P4E646_DRORH|nr:uncharacterized protein LOC108040516 [Drosophila rhopaloa]